MTVKDTVRSNILLYPSSFQNVIDSLIQALLTIGGGYEWSDNGELVDPTDDKKPPSIKEALDRARKNMIEQLINANQLNAVKQHQKDTVGFIIRNVKDVYNKEVSIIKNIKKREIDKSLKYTIKQWKSFMFKNRDFYIFYPTPGYNNIYKIPLNVTEDWLEACKLLYETMVTNIEYVHPDYKGNLPELKEKIDWVEKNRKPSNP